MQFFQHGPDIPERLLQAHEDGDVVFFCGAGISYPAGLPGFSGLVDRLYADLGVAPNEVQNAAIRSKQFDTAIGLLESEIVGGRGAVRQALVRILTPDFTKANATDTHDSLLKLSKSRGGHTRLVTTNFDRIFEELIDHTGLPIKRYLAPYLPLPKKRWNGLVYLHGLIPTTITQADLDRIVVSSGDFGLAYIAERWASRFISELFQKSSICFVGYSISDPVLRYMMDALAADRLLGEAHPEMFAFGSYSKGKRSARESEWKAKNVTPILYPEHHHHAYLHRTLREWSRTYSDGSSGKERIVVECAIARPTASTAQDDFVGRLLWAISDVGGLPAKRFAELDPVPALDWLEPLCDFRYQHGDLGRFGITPTAARDDDLTFSLVQRPSPYTKAAWMTIADRGEHSSRWDAVMIYLANWLLRHLDNPALLLWVEKRGGRLAYHFSHLVKNRLDEIAKLVRNGDLIRLEQIRSSAPHAIPRAAMRTLWRLVLANRVASPSRGSGLHSWLARLKQEGVTIFLRFELRQLLAPLVSFGEPFRWNRHSGNKNDGGAVEDLVTWEIVLSSEYVHSTLKGLSRHHEWTAALPDLIDDFGALLLDTMHLMRELGGADDKSDRSYFHRPSIVEHSQNNDFYDWTALIDLLRDAWMATAQRNPERGRQIAEGWWQLPYPLFRRLSFFAAAQGDTVPHRKSLDWILDHKCWWLWSLETQHEVMELLKFLVPRLSRADFGELENAVLAGPPREMYRESITPAEWVDVIDHSILRLLKTIVSTGVTLGAAAEARFADIKSKHIDWIIAFDDRDEFPMWSSGITTWRGSNAIPRSRRNIIKLFKDQTAEDRHHDDDWGQRCRSDFATTACALLGLAAEGIWPEDRWSIAMQAWADEPTLRRSWRYMAPTVRCMPDEKMKTCLSGVSWWLQAVAKTYGRYDQIFLELCQRVLTLDDGAGLEGGDVITQAINRPIGHVTNALLQICYRDAPQDGQGLPVEIERLLVSLCDISVFKFRFCRVILAGYVVALFRTDPMWTTAHLLPLFDWQRSSAEAALAWIGFLWSPRLYRPLIAAFKDSFLATSQHIESLGDKGAQYADLLTFAALEPGDSFTTAELAKATKALPAPRLSDASRALVRAVEGAGDQRAGFWRSRVSTYIRLIWPKSQEHASPDVATNFGRLCVATGEAFPEAFIMLRPWLRRERYAEHTVMKLHESGAPTRFPIASLDFLDLVISDSDSAPPESLKECLTEMRASDPKVGNDPRFRRLWDYVRRSE